MKMCLQQENKEAVIIKSEKFRQPKIDLTVSSEKRVVAPSHNDLFQNWQDLQVIDFIIRHPNY